MAEKSLENIIEGIVFVSGGSVRKADLEERLGVSREQVDEAVKNLREKFSGAQILLEFDEKLQFATSSEFEDEISGVLTPIREREFSQSMLEVVSIVAYKQPITRVEIEAIRGVSSEYAITSLAKQGIIEVVGKKDTVGHPFLFGTTDSFLKKFNLKCVEELPDYEAFVEKLKLLEEKFVGFGEDVFEQSIEEDNEENNNDIYSGI